MLYRCFCVLFTCVILTATLTARAAHADDNLFTNGEFTVADDNGTPAGWVWKGKEGTAEIVNDGDASFVSIFIQGDSQDNFIEQTPAIPEDAVKLKISARYRWSDVVGGPRGYEEGKIQGRMKRADGSNAGHWIDIAQITGSSDGWIERDRIVGVPDDAAKLMFRIGYYGSKSGRIDVDYFRVEPLTEQDMAEERAKYRPAEEYGPAVTDARYDRIRHGIAINNWFCQPWNVKIAGTKGGFNAQHFRGYITERDIRMLADAGFDHIRLPIDPLFLIDRDTGDLNTELLGEVDRAIRMIRDAGLAVIVDIHPKNNSFKKIRGKPLADRFIKWWGQFARHMHETTDPEWVFLELLNEPGGQGFWVNSWQPYQDKLITIVRANAPGHTIVANGGAYMLAWELPNVEPHTDRNVIWAFHFYEPSPFTHQGAQWMKDWYRPLRQVPWPLTEENLAEAQASVVASDKAADHAKKVLADQLKSGWGTEGNIARRFDPVEAWSNEHDRRVVIGEFGVYTEYAPRESRLRYMKAITEEMNQRGWGWSKWGYCHGYHVLKEPYVEPDQRELDMELIRTMGLGGE